jgi:hypothetical protein
VVTSAAALFFFGPLCRPAFGLVGNLRWRFTQEQTTPPLSRSMGEAFRLLRSARLSSILGGCWGDGHLMPS